MEGSSIAKKPGKLLNLGLHEQQDELEQKLENGFAIVLSRMGNLHEREAHDQLLQAVADAKMYEVVIGGLLYGVLSDPVNASKYYDALTLVANGSWFCALCNVNMVLFELYPRLHNEARQQILFFFRESIRVNVPKIDNVLINLIRNANDGGDFKDSCKMLTGVVGLLNENYPWLSNLKPKASLIPVILIVFSRYIYELTMTSQNDSLCTQMVKCCEWLLKERFMDCAQLGRDLVLILMLLSKIPQFSVIWKNLQHSPTKLAPNFGGIEELLSRPCLSNFPIYHVSVTMQRKMEFLFKLRPGTHEKHIEWIRLKHLSSADSGSLRASLVRCACFLSSEPPYGIEMRAILIATILAQSASGVEQQWCKLNLFWDWFCYDPQMGAHNLIEPGYSVIRQLLHVQPLLANSLLDFLTRMSAELYPPLRNRMQTSVANALKAIADCNIGSPSAIVDHQMVQKSVRDAFREAFKLPSRGVPSTQTLQATTTPTTTQPATPTTDSEPVLTIADIIPSVNSEQSNNKSASKTKQQPQQQPPDVTNNIDVSTTNDTEGCSEKIAVLLAAIKEEFRDGIESLSNASRADNEVRCELTNRLMSSLFDSYELLDGEQIELIAECFLTIFQQEFFSRKPLTDDFTPTPETFDQLFNDPIYVIFRSFCLLPDEDAVRQPMLSLISEMRERCSSVSYLLLFYIFSGRTEQNDIDVTVYKDLCRELGKPLLQHLVADLDTCHMDDYVLFGHLVTIVYDKFANEACGSVELMKLLAYSLDSSQVMNLMSAFIRENITLFRKDSFAAMLTASLQWEATAQLIFWQLVHGECVPIDWAIQVIPKLQYAKHAEAVGNIYIMLSRYDREPTMGLVRSLLSRSYSDMFTVDCLKILISDTDSIQRIAELLANLIDKAIHSGDLTPQSLSAGKQKRPNQRSVCLEQLFAHLDLFRQNCLSKGSHLAEQFLARRELQTAFDNARKSDKVSSLRLRFSELFAVMEILSDDGAHNQRSSRRKTNKKAADASDDETKAKRKRQKLVLLDSDSE